MFSLVLTLTHNVQSAPLRVAHTLHAVWSASVSGWFLAVHHLVGQCHRGTVDEGALFVSSLQEIRKQLSFTLHKDRAPPHKAETIFLQDVVAVLHHLGETRIHTHKHTQSGLVDAIKENMATAAVVHIV